MSTRIRTIAGPVFLCAALALAARAAVAQSGDIPKRPEQLVFAELSFEPPRAEEYRRELAGGIPVYLAPSRELPLITLSLAFRGGAYLDPPERRGLAALTGALMRQGGTARLSADELDEKLDLLAARADVRVGATESGASLDALSMNFEEAFALFIEMLREPGFDEGKLAIHQANLIERMKSQNDDAADIIGREFAALMYGREHFAAVVPTKEMIEKASVAEMRDMHRRIFNPANLIVAASGDFDPEALCARLEQAFAGWPAGEALPAVPAPASEPEPGIYHVHKDIPQGKVIIGLRGIRRDDPDALVMELMNDILGGGGFTSRITQRVRSDEGLAYSAGSQLDTPVHFPGAFVVSFETKNATVPFAISIAFEEIARIRGELVSVDELEVARNGRIEAFPTRFGGAERMLQTLVQDEMTGRPVDHWQTYRARLRAATPEDIRAAAARLLDTDRLVVLIGGDYDAIAEGDEHATLRPERWAELEAAGVAGGPFRAFVEKYGGAVRHLPLRDPLTQEPLAR